MKYLFIAEKPSLMREVQSCYNNHTREIIDAVGEMDFTALSGHVCTNYEPNDYEEWNDKWDQIKYPMVPQVWKIKAIDNDHKRDTIEKIRAAVSRYDGIVVGTDSDVEGYGIYYLLEHFLHIENKHALRFMEHSLTEQEILKSLLSMSDYHNDPVHVRFTQSFLIRSRADWLYGMNATRIASVRSGDLMTIGRVKAPTIKLVYDNSMAIEKFVPEKYYTLNAVYNGFESTLVDEERNAIKFKDPGRMPHPPLAGIVAQKETKESKVHAPKLYDLTSIQAEAGQLFGYNPSQTLEIIQSLYEKHKVISYPRTQCRYVSTEKAGEFPRMLSNMSAFPSLAKYATGITQADIKRVMSDRAVVNDTEVQKESHDALLPTSKRPVLEEMTSQEVQICEMIYRRLLAQFLPKLVENKTTLLIRHRDFNFLANGKSIVGQGWRVLYKEAVETLIPPLEENDSVTAEKMENRQKTTTPPKRLTQASLVLAMKNIANLINDKDLKKSLNDSQGIGTSATRAAIISDIIKRGYVAEKKGGLYISQLGKEYIEALGGLEITSPVFAAVMDTDIKRVQRGEATYEEVYRKVLGGLYGICSQLAQMKPASKETSVPCYNCGGSLKTERYSYACDSCGIKIPRNICGQVIDDEILMALFSNGQTLKFYSFENKEGKKFKARLVVEGGNLKFSFHSDVSCPYCGGDVTINRGGAFCDCGLKVFRKMAGYAFSDSQLRTLLQTGHLDKVNGFVSKNGKKFSAGVELNEGTTSFVF